MNILLVDWHEAFIHNLCKLDHQFFIIEPKLLGMLRIDGKNEWQTSYRPFPKNATRITDFSQVREGLKEHQFDITLGLTYFDLAFFQKFPLPKIYSPISSFRDDLGIYEILAPAYQNEIYSYILSLMKAFVLAFWTREIMQKELQGSALEGHIFDSGGLFDPEDYHSYTGKIPGVLRVGHLIKQRTYYNAELHDQVLNGIPHLILGANPDLPNSRLSKDWEDLKHCLREYRVFLATYSPDYHLPCPLAQLEAMATGMPVVTTPHTGCLVKDGVNGFVSSDPQVLREKLLLLLQNRDLAISLGKNARASVLEKYAITKHKAEWELLFKQAQQSKTNKSASTPLPDNDLALHWEGPYFYGEPFGSLNRKSLQAFQKLSGEVFPVPREPKRNPDTQNPHFVDLLKVLETLGECALREDHAELRILSPFDQPLYPLSTLKAFSGKTNAFFCWEHGAIPIRWQEAVKVQQISEVWVNSHTEKRFYEAQGIPDDKLIVFPRGIDPIETSPTGFCVNLPVENKFVFFFIGNALSLEGGDLALIAYLNEFKKDENVSLIYVCTSEAPELFERINLLVATGEIPEMYPQCIQSGGILNVFYRAASFALVPHRGLAVPRFLPELIGSGLPFAVTDYGGGGDSQSLGTSYLIPSIIKNFEHAHSSESLTSEPFLAEPEVDTLRRILRHVYQHPKETRIRGLLGRQIAFQTSTWDKVCTKILKHIKEPATKAIRENSTLALLFKEQQGKAYRDKAATHLLFQEWKEASDLATRSLEFIPKDSLTKSILAEAKANLKENDSLTLIQELFKHESPPRETIPHLIKALQSLGETGMIDHFMERGLDADSKLLGVLGILESGNKEEAFKRCEKIGRTANNAVACAILGLLREDTDPIEALFHYERGMEIDPALAFLRLKIHNKLGIAS